MGGQSRVLGTRLQRTVEWVSMGGRGFCHCRCTWFPASSGSIRLPFHISSRKSRGECGWVKAIYYTKVYIYIYKIWETLPLAQAKSHKQNVTQWGGVYVLQVYLRTIHFQGNFAPGILIDPENPSEKPAKMQNPHWKLLICHFTGVGRIQKGGVPVCQGFLGVPRGSRGWLCKMRQKRTAKTKEISMTCRRPSPTMGPKKCLSKPNCNFPIECNFSTRIIPYSVTVVAYNFERQE